MLRRYSMWIGDTARSTDSDRSIGRPFCVELRQERHGGGVDVGDDAQQRALVELARLARDVGWRIMQAEERADAAARAFGDDMARSVGVEAIDHHPVEAGQRAHLARRLR